MSFDINKVKIKHILGIHKDMNGYPTGEDLLYFIVKHYHDRGKEMDNITFTDHFLIKKLGKKHKESIHKAIDELLHNKTIESFRENKDSISYKILKNSYA